MLIITFLTELIKANFGVLKLFSNHELRINPDSFVYETELERDWQLVLLSNLITLTPGTVVLGISDDRKRFISTQLISVQRKKRFKISNLH